MATPWLALIRQRGEGTCDDPCWDRYYAGIDRLSRKVYRSRYGKVAIPSTTSIWEGEGASNYQRGNYNFSNGLLRVDFDHFSLRCWEILEEIERQILYRGLSGDSDCERYLFSCFSHLLQEMIDGLAPFFKGRRKQVGKVLGEIADAVTYGEERCYRLKTMSSQIPASRDTLFEAASRISAPAPRFPENPDSDRGPTVPFEAMRDYLQQLYTEVGGTIVYTDLLDLIKLVYGLTPPRQIDPTYYENRGDGEGAVDDLLLIDELTAGESNTLPTALTVAMAREFHGRLSDRDLAIFYWRRCKGLGVVKTAKMLGCSVGTVSDTLKTIFSKIQGYLFDQNVAAGYGDVEELNAVVAVLEHLVAAQKEAP